MITYTMIGVYITFWILLILLLLARNLWVYNYRGRLIEKLANKSKEEVNKGTYDNWSNYWVMFNSVSYNKMVWQLWRRLDSFYPEEFLKEVGMK